MIKNPQNPGMNAAALRGAVDLGALAQAKQSPSPSAAGGAFVKDVTTASFQADVIEQSMTVPVVLDLWATWCGPCKQLSPVLEKLAADYNGRFILAKIDVDAEQQIAAAFQVQSIPSVFAVLKGQPIPLFQGALPEPQIKQYLDELFKVAAENGITGTATAAPDEPPVEEVIDTRLDLAADAVAAEDWDTAERHYQSLLDDNPQDLDAKAGLALVALQRRLAGVDDTAAIQASDEDPADVDKAIVAADVNLASGDAERAYARLIQAVRLSAGEERDRARTRLLELFDMATSDDPTVMAARRQLAAALY